MNLSLLPAGSSKTVHFVRHGEGTHNVAGALDHSQYKQERYFDAHLTTLGWQQGAALKAHVASQDKPLTATLQLVVVSPLTRAVETAVAAFGGACPAPPGEPLLMEAQSAVEGLRVERPSVSAVGVPPFLVCELCREHLGVHPCDRRRPLSYYRKAYPALDWSQVEEEEDVLWTADTRESDEALALRAGAFLRWLALRPEQHIAVVTHSSWLDILFRSFTGECSPAASMRLKNWFKNAELRTVILHDGACVGRPAAQDFIPELATSAAAPAEDPASVVSA